MDILVLSSWYPHRSDPFIGNFVQRHCRALALQHRVWVFHVVNVGAHEETGIERRDLGNLREIRIYRRRSGIPFLDYFAKRRVLMKAIGHEGVAFDLIHAHVLYPLAPLFAYVARKLRLPWVFTEHWSGFHKKFRPEISPIKWQWILRAAGSASRGFPVSQNLLNSLRDVLPETPLFSVPNVVEPVFFSAERRPNSGKLRFLHVSTLDERHKNIKGTLEAFGRLKEAGIDFEFVIITDGDRRLAVQTAEALGLEDRISIEGPASPEEIAREMAISDALILFSNTENQPCVVLESLAVGLPVIASTVGDIPNLVTRNRGILVEPGNVEDLAEELLKFANGEVEFHAELVTEGVYETFSFEAVCKRYTAHYAEVLERR